ncbi:hypothetical protein F5J12DRAFT_955231 [Pisolithus orientalis]|uniref:uncharacterized protein n=1 Tax=Pisolithus orientalis TaxID=936130 RepID=UPI00222485AD|nr:uncharacterized protein F5J12DRAFT_955231 [Pisolithus orientalis]KAI6030919.1 hypothetical protein F5J12DRAFT_955231 [Pisolithus orientalis]
MHAALFSFFVAVFFSVFARAAPVTTQPVELLVFSPTITSPTAGIVWITNTKANVTWLTSNIPAEKQNTTGLLLLGYEANNSENLDIYHPLASQFPLAQGWVEFTVPSNLTYKNNYIVVLFGDSGNASPQFTITPNNATQS